MGNTLKYHMDPEWHPYDDAPLEFDPLYGFPEGVRKKKEPRVTAAEIESTQPPYDCRTYCLHKVLEVKKCHGDHYPFLYKCNHKVDEYFDCENEEFKDRMKDYERERRLLQRKKRIMLKQQEREEKLKKEAISV